MISFMMNWSRNCGKPLHSAFNDEIPAIVQLLKNVAISFAISLDTNEADIERKDRR